MADSGTIRVRNAVFYAYHGVREDEQQHGGKYEVDVDMDLDLTAAGETDSLKRTVDYEAVYDRVQRVATSKKYYLLESLAENIGRVLMREFSLVDRVVVRVRKPHPPVKGVIDHVEVEIVKTR